MNDLFINYYLVSQIQNKLNTLVKTKQMIFLKKIFYLLSKMIFSYIMVCINVTARLCDSLFFIKTTCLHKL